MKPIYPKPGGQKDKVLKALLSANGEWVNSQHFLHVLHLSQFHTRIFELQNENHWPIEPSQDSDEFGYKSYRLAQGIAPRKKEIRIVERDGRRVAIEVEV